MTKPSAQPRGDVPTISAFGPGKIILFGEHAVVYGQPALAAPIARGVTAYGFPDHVTRLDLPRGLPATTERLLRAAFAKAADISQHPPVRVELKSNLPQSVGLGSSAAVSVACGRLLLRAAGKPEDPAEVAKVAWEMEQVFHGTPSGIDHTASALGQMILFRRARPLVAPRIRPVSCPRSLRVLVVLVGKRPPTKVTVAALKERRARWKRRYERIFHEMGKLTLEGRRAVEQGDLEGLGDLMNVNHGLLAALQLSSDAVDAMVHKLRGLGALGAKLTGAGGDGGAVIGLFHDPRGPEAELLSQGVTCFHTQLSGPGEP